MRIGIAGDVEEHGRRGGRRRGLAVIDCRVAVAFGKVNDHEAAAADITGARIGDREREADRHRRVHRIAAAGEDFHADAGGAAFLRHHHAIVGKDRRCRWYGGRPCDLGERDGTQQQS